MRFKAETSDSGEREWKELEDRVERVDGSYVDIGWHADGEQHPDDNELLLAEIAAVNEFGTKPGVEPVIPERSVLRSTADERQGPWGRLLDKCLQKVQDGADPLRQLSAFGELAASDVKRKITVLRRPPNAPSTIERKGSSNPWIDTGATRNAVHSVVVVGSRTVRTAKGAA